MALANTCKKLTRKMPLQPDTRTYAWPIARPKSIGKHSMPKSPTRHS